MCFARQGHCRICRASFEHVLSWSLYFSEAREQSPSLLRAFSRALRATACLQAARTRRWPKAGPSTSGSKTLSFARAKEKVRAKLRRSFSAEVRPQKEEKPEPKPEPKLEPKIETKMETKLPPKLEDEVRCRACSAMSL